MKRVSPFAVLGEIGGETGEASLELRNGRRRRDARRNPRPEVVEVRLEDWAERDGVLLPPSMQEKPIGQYLERKPHTCFKNANASFRTLDRAGDGQFA